MVEINGNFIKVKSWISKRIRISSYNTFVGRDTGKVATGDSNDFLGYKAGYSCTTGHHNNFLGHAAGYSCTTGHSNDFLGYAAGYSCTTGHYNNFLGYNAGYSCTTGHHNNFLGHAAGYSCTTGHSNDFLGYKAGYSCTTGHHNNFLGYNAGYYETGNYKLIVDVLARADEANERIKALIYGVFDAATANQLLRINAILELTEIKNGATQVGAGAGANEIWKTNGHATLPDNVLMIGI